jgi:lysophospholipase L1-like esterase
MFWYEDEVKRLESAIAGLNHEPGLIFYGSSSIRLWETLEDDFKEFTPLNIGFGGSTLAACGWFFDRVFAKLNPSSIIVYAGDNDLGDGRNPEEVLLFFNSLIQYVQHRYGDIPLGFISIKPSIKRWDIADKIKHTNYLIQDLINKTGGNSFYINIYDSMTDANGYPKTELLQPDGLHVSKKGYHLWKEIILNSVAKQNLNLIRA